MSAHRMGWRRTVGAALAASALAALANPPDEEVIHSSIILLDRRPGGQLVFRLANGQAWVQQAVRFIAVEAGERVVIAPARLGGGHILATERSASTRVRQLEDSSAWGARGVPE